MFRFPVKHEIVKRILSIVQTCFDEGNVQLFNDVALNAVNIIYKVSFIHYLVIRNKYYYL